MDIAKVGGVLAELEAAFFDIPFENSDFQNRAFVVAAQQTPARAYRAIGLRMFAKIRAVKDFEISKARRQVDIDEKEYLLAKSSDEFERRRLTLDLLELREAGSWGEKLLNDALRELDCLYGEFRKLPKFTREAFEAEEQHHFELRLTRQITTSGPSESLLNMHRDVPELAERAKLLALG